jgi:hypothetical protein
MGTVPLLKDAEGNSIFDNAGSNFSEMQLFNGSKFDTCVGIFDPRCTSRAPWRVGRQMEQMLGGFFTRGIRLFHQKNAKLIINGTMHWLSRKLSLKITCGRTKRLCPWWSNN